LEIKVGLTKKNHSTLDETRKFEKGKLEVIKVGEFTLGRGTYEPGWKWSSFVKPIVKTDSCQAHHVGYAVSGRMVGVMNDGSKWEIGPGDSVDLHPSHDAWTVRNEPAAFIEFMRAAQYAKPK
jgi:hypothetical protein